MKTLKDYGSFSIGFAYSGLESIYGVEFIRLDNTQAGLLALDLLQASDDDPSMSVRDYANRIGEGNLSSYMKCLEIPSRRK